MWKVAAHRGDVNSVEGTELCLVSGGNDNKVCVWSRRSHQLMLQFTEHIKPVVAVLPDVTNPHLIHSAGKDRCVFTYDLKKEKRVVGHQVRVSVCCRRHKCRHTRASFSRHPATHSRCWCRVACADGQECGGHLHGAVTA